MELLNQLEFFEGLEWNLMFPVFSLVVILLSYLMLLKDLLGQKLKTTIRQEEQMDIQEKIFLFQEDRLGSKICPWKKD